MKKRWLPLVFAALLVLAPVASADGGSAPGWFEELISQVVAIVMGDEAVPSSSGNTVAQPGTEPEIGELIPPWG
jgi:hypothetical protein